MTRRYDINAHDPAWDDLARDQAKLAKLHADVLEDKDEAARLSSDRQQEKTLRAAIRSDREKLKSDLKQFRPNSPQVQADRTQLASDESALAKVRADLHALRHEENLEEKSEKAHARTLAAAPAHTACIGKAAGHH